MLKSIRYHSVIVAVTHMQLVMHNESNIFKKITRSDYVALLWVILGEGK